MKTALYDKHVALGAKIVDFAGWEMPLQYKGIISEHQAVRQRAGIFDVSHMGRIVVSGTDAEPFLDHLSTNVILGKPYLSAIYTVWANEQGGSIDDVIVYKQSPTHFFVVVNAGNRQKDLDHLKQHAKLFDVKLKDLYRDGGILAIQGPQALTIAAKIFREAAEIVPMHFIPTTYQGEEIILSGTGYTGAGGLEVYGCGDAIVELWERFLNEGKNSGIEPIGLGARDTLRLEMGYALYGHELSDLIVPNESVSAWTVKWKKGDFIGKATMLDLEQDSKKRTAYGIVLLDKGIAREGYDVFMNGVPIGQVTSGTFSPTLNQAIALILVQGRLREGDIVDVQIRQNRVRARVVSLPFLTHATKVQTQ